MTDDETPIAYTALEEGTPVFTSDGGELGTVEAVLSVEEVDVFDGIVVNTLNGLRFVDADRVGLITAAFVRSTISAEDAGNLPEPDDDSPVLRTDAHDDVGGSIADRFGRMFGRGKWHREQ